MWQWLHSLNSTHKSIKQGTQYVLPFENNFLEPHQSDLFSLKHLKWNKSISEAHELQLWLWQCLFLSTVQSGLWPLSVIRVYGRKGQPGKTFFFPWPWTQLHSCMTRWMAQDGMETWRTVAWGQRHFPERLVHHGPAVVSEWVTDSHEIRALPLCETFHNSPQKSWLWFASQLQGRFPGGQKEKFEFGFKYNLLMALEGIQAHPTASAGGDVVYIVVVCPALLLLLEVQYLHLGPKKVLRHFNTSLTSYIIEASTHMDVNCSLSGALQCSAGQ